MWRDVNMKVRQYRGMGFTGGDRNDSEYGDVRTIPPHHIRCDLIGHVGEKTVRHRHESEAVSGDGVRQRDGDNSEYGDL